MRLQQIQNTLSSIYFPLLVIVVAILSIPLFLTTVAAAEFFVSNSGNDSDSGTLDSPFKTIKQGISVAQPGDSVVIRGGVYNERISSVRSGTERISPTNANTISENSVEISSTSSLSEVKVGDYLYVYRSKFSNNGVFRISNINENIVEVEGASFQTETGVIITIGKPIYIKAQTNEEVTIDANKLSNGVSLSGHNYIIVDGLNITKANTDGVFMTNGASHNVIRNSNIFNNGHAGVKIWRYSKYNTVQNNDISDNGVVRFGEGIYVNIDPGGWNESWGTNGKPDGSDFTHVIGNTIRNADENAIEFKHSAQYGIIADNLIEGTRTANYNSAIYLQTNNDNTYVYGNKILNTKSSDKNNTGAIAIDGTIDLSNVLVYNNLIVNSEDGGILTGRYKGVKIYHNTIVGGTYGIRLYFRGSSGAEIKNNILSKNQNHIGNNVSGYVISHNLFDGNSTLKGTNFVQADPKFVNSTDFSLSIDSPAIGKGTDVGILNDIDGNNRLASTGIDIGAYQFTLDQLPPIEVPEEPEPPIEEPEDPVEEPPVEEPPVEENPEEPGESEEPTIPSLDELEARIKELESLINFLFKMISLILKLA